MTKQLGTAIAWSLFAASCQSAGGAGMASGTTPTAAGDAPRTGTLVTYLGSQPIGTEQFEDTEAELRSVVRLAGTESSVTIRRADRSVVVRRGDETFERVVPDGALVLENGSWQAYAVAADWIGETSSPVAVQVLQPSMDAASPATISVTREASGARIVELTIGPVTVTARVSPEGLVTHAAVPAQGVEVRREGEPAPEPPAERGAPDGITESTWEVTRDGVALHAVHWRPATMDGPLPTVVLIAGSGPTDRDGNSAVGLRTDCYRLLAQALAERGIASVRYDKRGVGRSGRNFDPAATTLEHMVDDTLAIIAYVRANLNASAVTLAGHSEGGLIALLAAGRTPIDGLVLIATAGRTFRVLVREQLARQLSEEQMVEVDRIFDALDAGQPLGEIAAPLDALFNPRVLAYVRSEMDVDPVPMFRALRVPAVIVQGENDAQVSSVDARALGAARPDARLILLPRINHVLKEEASAELSTQASYADPSRPLGPGVLDAVLAGVATQPHTPARTRARPRR